MAGRFVIDASVAIGAMFQDEASAYGIAVVRSLPGSVALAPAIWPLEASNAVLVAERRQRISADEVAWFLDSLGSLPVMIMPLAVERVWERTALLAREMNLTLYDALYLELALSEGLPLATLDQELRSAASRCGVPAYQP